MTAALRLAGCLAAGALLVEPRRDLDVAIPPGSPVDWSKAFPAITPEAGPLFATTPGRGGDVNEGRTTSKPASAGMDVQVSSSFGLVRILTWDLAAHLSWVQMQPSSRGPRTGHAGNHPELPLPGDALYWMTVAPLLRLMLHPEAVSRAETLVHLTEIGEPTLAILGAAASEEALRDPVLWLHTYIEPSVDAQPKAKKGEDPRETMLLRFVFEELATKYPHDPVSGFGERLFLFSEDLERLVASYVDDECAFVRRNAVAALARYETLSAVNTLLDAAADTGDPVVLVRALNGISRFRGRMDTRSLEKRLADTADPMTRVALIAALGKMNAESATPKLLKLGEEALPEDTDLLMAILSALARMHHRAHRGEVAAFVERVDREATNKPKEFRPPGKRSTLRADSPDPPEMRGEILAQLALIVRVRLDAGDKVLARRLLALRETAPVAGDPRLAFTARGSNDSLRFVHPPVRFLYLRALREVGEEGVKALREIVLDKRTESSLRGFALVQLPWEDQVAAAASILADPGEPTGMRIQALEVSAAGPHPAIEAQCRALLAKCAAMEPGGGDPEERYLYLTAIRALSKRKLLTTEDVVPLLVHPKDPRHSFDRLPEEVRRRVEGLVALAAQGGQKTELRERIDELLAMLLRQTINPAITEPTRAKHRKHVLGLISGAKAHQTDLGYQRLIVDAVVEYLLGYALPRVNRNQGEFLPRVMLEEEILLSLGRTREPQASELLISFLNNKRNRYRAVACLALGVAGHKSAERTLAAFLLDDDGFTRYCAYESLRHLSGRDVFADWMYGKSAERFEAAEAYWRWLVEKR